MCQKAEASNYTYKQVYDWLKLCSKSSLNSSGGSPVWSSGLYTTKYQETFKGFMYSHDYT